MYLNKSLLEFYYVYGHPFLKIHVHANNFFVKLISHKSCYRSKITDKNLKLQLGVATSSVKAKSFQMSLCYISLFHASMLHKEF